VSYPRDYRYFIVLGLVIVLGTEGLVVAQRRAKTKPVVPSSKAVQKPQGPKAELLNYARKYLTNISQDVEEPLFTALLRTS
jgi:hypothetical protein